MTIAGSFCDRNGGVSFLFSVIGFISVFKVVHSRIHKEDALRSLAVTNSIEQHVYSSRPASILAISQELGIYSEGRQSLHSKTTEGDQDRKCSPCPLLDMTPRRLRNSMIEGRCKLDGGLIHSACLYWVCSIGSNQKSDFFSSF
jgi:hypothetical protein